MSNIFDASLSSAKKISFISDLHASPNVAKDNVWSEGENNEVQVRTANHMEFLLLLSGGVD